MSALLHPYSAALMKRYLVSRRMNNPGYEKPDGIVPSD
jgi:hypothetical protein